MGKCGVHPKCTHLIECADCGTCFFGYALRKRCASCTIEHERVRRIPYYRAYNARRAARAVTS